MTVRWERKVCVLPQKIVVFTLRVSPSSALQVSSGALDLAKANLEQMLKLCAEPLSGDNASEELVVAQTMSLHDVIHELVRQVTSPNTLVRDQVCVMSVTRQCRVTTVLVSSLSIVSVVSLLCQCHHKVMSMLCHYYVSSTCNVNVVSLLC